MERSNIYIYILKKYIKKATESINRISNVLPFAEFDVGNDGQEFSAYNLKKTNVEVKQTLTSKDPTGYNITGVIYRVGYVEGQEEDKSLNTKSSALSSSTSPSIGGVFLSTEMK